MKLIRENKYKGSISRKIIKGTISLGIVGGIFFSAIPTNHTMVVPEPYGYTIISDKEKKDFVISNIQNEKILPKNTSDIIEDKLLDEFIEKTTNNDIKDSDSKEFRDYILKNYMENNDSVQNLIKKTNTSNKIKFDKNGLSYVSTIDFEDKQTSGYFFMEQAVSNKKIEFSSTNFINKSFDDSYSYYSYEIIFKKGKTDEIKSILIENNSSSNNEECIVTIKLFNDEEITSSISKENIEFLKKNVLEKIDADYSRNEFEKDNEEILFDVLGKNNNKIYYGSKQLKK